MLRIINLLNQKNHFLEKFYSINETELLNFSKGNFDNLEDFYQSRERILSIVRQAIANRPSLTIPKAASK